MTWLRRGRAATATSESTNAASAPRALEVVQAPDLALAFGVVVAHALTMALGVVVVHALAIAFGVIGAHALALAFGVGVVHALALAFGMVVVHALALALVVVVALAFAPILPHLELLQSCSGERPLPCVFEPSPSGSWSLLGLWSWRGLLGLRELRSLLRGVAVARRWEWGGNWGRKGPSEPLQWSLERLGAKDFRENKIPVGDHG